MQFIPNIHDTQIDFLSCSAYQPFSFAENDKKIKTQLPQNVVSPLPTEPHVLPTDSMPQLDLYPPTRRALVLYCSCLSHSELDLKFSMQLQAHHSS